MSTNALELHVRGVAAALHDHQVARLYKIPNDVRFDGGKTIHGGQTPCDFMGWTITGRAVAIECKMFKGPSLPFKYDTGLKAHQMLALMECHKAGGIGLLVWQRKLEIAIIDPDQVAHYSKDRMSIPWKVIPAKFKKSLATDPLQFFWPWLCVAREEASLPQ